MALFAAKKKKQGSAVPAVDSSQRTVSRYLSKLKFSYRLGGVDEADVWRKIEKLCELYEDALADERERRQYLEEALRKLKQSEGTDHE